MGLFKWIFKRSSCVSKCSFNNDEFDIDFYNRSFKDYELKNKDLIRIGSILKKRGTRPQFPKECKITI